LADHRDVATVLEAHIVQGTQEPTRERLAAADRGAMPSTLPTHKSRAARSGAIPFGDGPRGRWGQSTWILFF